jgi:hypothetical protein
MSTAHAPYSPGGEHCSECGYRHDGRCLSLLARIRFILGCRSTGRWPGKLACLLLDHVGGSVICPRCGGLGL